MEGGDRVIFDKELVVFLEVFLDGGFVVENVFFFLGGWVVGKVDEIGFVIGCVDNIIVFGML